MAHIAIENLSFSYSGSERRVLDGVSLDIKVGSYVLLCGKSGSGKTTLLRHLKSALAPHGTKEGRVLVNGIPLEDISLYNQSNMIAYVQQDPNAQIVTDKVWHELAFGLESIGCDASTMHSRVAEMATFFGIQDWFDCDVHELSGGQKQLLNLASAMVMHPRVLVLDEPTAQLDPLAAADFLNTIRKINIELGVTVIISEHRLEEVYRLADKIVILDHGKVVCQGTTREVAAAVYRADNEMKYALPVPMRIYHGVKSFKDIESCPLTIREARAWLKSVAEERGIRVRHLPDRNIGRLSGTPVLELSNIHFKYEKNGKEVLKNLNLNVLQGNLHAIVGGNGTGKSTTLKIACGAIKNFRGSVRLAGKKLSKWSESELHQSQIAMLPQNLLDLFSHETVREELEEMLEFKHLSKDEVDFKVNSVSHNVGIINLLDSHPYDLSGGEQQLVAIAKVLMRDVKVLLLDEPTKGIDTFSKRRLAKLLHELIDSGKTVLLVSHDVEFCAKYATTVSMLFNGSIVTTNTPQAFFSSNMFYTTAASRISRELFTKAVTDEELFILCLENDWQQL